MIKVNVLSDSEGNYRSIELKGHSGYDEYGKDIICAAVSSLTLNMANSIEEFTNDGFDGSSEEETGHFKFKFTGNVSPESKLLMDSLILGLKSIAETYGEKYIKIRFEEV
ncbi:MAG: ribosomal-processing cysteine protease Prp [Clostridium sp.]